VGKDKVKNLKDGADAIQYLANGSKLVVSKDKDGNLRARAATALDVEVIDHNLAPGKSKVSKEDGGVLISNSSEKGITTLRITDMSRFPEKIGKMGLIGLEGHRAMAVLQSKEGEWTVDEGTLQGNYLGGEVDKVPEMISVDIHEAAKEIKPGQAKLVNIEGAGAYLVVKDHNDEKAVYHRISTDNANSLEALEGSGGFSLPGSDFALVKGEGEGVFKLVKENGEV
jgi:hypothetical protein